jgi:hypothetical protein
LADLVKGCGTNCAWSLDSLTRRNGSTTGSRFGLDNRQLVDNPITGRGLSLKTVNLKRTPNVELICCHLKELPAHKMPVYLHWLGLERVRDTNYFTYNEAAVINMVLNMTRLVLVSQDEERFEAMTDQFSKLKLFETQVPGPSSKSLTGHVHRLSSFSMLEFAQCFMDCLESLANSNDEFDKCFTKYMTGMDFNADSAEKLNVGYMKAFCNSLNHNCYFVASLAGCKVSFHEKPFLTLKFKEEHQLNLDFLQEQMQRTTSEIYRILREEVFVCELMEIKPRQAPRQYKRDDGGMQYHFDFGMEFSPLKEDNVSFFLNGHKTKAQFKVFMNKQRTVVPVDLDEAPNPLPNSVEDIDDESETLENEEEPEPGEESESEVDLAEIFNEEDNDLFESGEVEGPNQARLESNYESDSDEEEGESSPVSGFWDRIHESGNGHFFRVFGICFINPEMLQPGSLSWSCICFLKTEMLQSLTNI